MGQAFSLPTGFPASRGDLVAHEFFNGVKPAKAGRGSRNSLINSKHLPYICKTSKNEAAATSRSPSRSLHWEFMKKLMSVFLGLALVAGSVPMVFGQSGSGKAKKHGKGKKGRKGGQGTRGGPSK